MMRRQAATRAGSSRLSASDLVSLYSEQWEHIRHLDTLDVRMLSVLPIVVAVLTVGGQYLTNGKTPPPCFS